MGSPPLARGTAKGVFDSNEISGITPACAGNSLIVVVIVHLPWDHPRLRGEQQDNAKNKVGEMGSPPLARGTVGDGHGVSRGRGITPACAGNRIPSPRPERGAKDHPRLRGEQEAWTRPTGLVLGSPPLARGTADGNFKIQGLIGITPACAGNSLRTIIGNTQMRDHPRLRGEQRMLGGRDPQQMGSPPLARGTVYSFSPSATNRGITPACAGNRRCGRFGENLDRDHPRLRGEQRSRA